uniref:Ubiquitin carboxyl-terminal hydrolase MINDY n=1 Tax=Mola mola TaxID=94237 RepID=A0A3Q3XN65_MOLML
AMAASVEEVSSSLVREYLSRKGLKRTIACMDEEHPRTEASINNRSHLRQILNMEGLYRKNKVQDSPLKTLLEIIVKHRIMDLKNENINTYERDLLHSSSAVSLNVNSPAASSNDTRTEESATVFVKREKHPFISESAQKSRTNRVRRGMMTGPIASTSQVMNSCCPSYLSSHSSHCDALLMCFLKGIKQQKTESKDRSAPAAARERWGKQAVIYACVSLEMPGQHLFYPLMFCWLPIFLIYQELKMVLLGSRLNCFTVEWRNQGFTFSETHDLRYGFVQKKGGPCGVMASVQAFVLKKLLFESSDGSDPSLQPANATRRKCLVQATADILWRAGEEKQATVTMYDHTFTYIYLPVCEMSKRLSTICLFALTCLPPPAQFETGALGCILLTVSAVLSRSVEKVREDLDVPTTALIGAHGYCTQELVNLLVHGRAVPNVFDNDMLLDSGKGNTTVLKGIKGQCDVGLLSLFEHYNICKVGAYLKTPCYPIWLVCSESHFSVLFGLQRALLTSQDKGLEFDLYYYDGLANQQEEIRLTVCICQNIDSDLIPPLEHCIRTRWKDASVNWNDTEPIL